MYVLFLGYGIVRVQHWLMAEWGGSKIANELQVLFWDCFQGLRTECFLAVTYHSHTWGGEGLSGAKPPPRTKKITSLRNKIREKGGK